MDSRGQDQKAIYLHVKQVEYLVPCPPCKMRGHRATCRICDGRGKVHPKIAEHFTTERDGEISS